MASLCKSYHGALGRTRRYAQAKSSGLDVREDLKSESVYDCACMCIYMRACAGVQREQSRQSNRQMHWVPVRSGARWSVSGDDT